jgi:DNA invertase Pin-like site-specific DNA recombinase
MKKAVGYIRVSTKHQGKSGCGLEAQKAAIKAFADSSGYELISVEQDIWTGRGPESFSQRGGLRNAITLAKNAEASIIFWDSSRVSREIVSFVNRMKMPMPDLVRIRNSDRFGTASIVAEVARADVEAKHLIKRTTQGMDRARKRGVSFGNPVNLAEARQKGVLENIRRGDDFFTAIAPAIAGHRATGISTASGIAAALNADGFLSPYGKVWTKENIRNTLKRMERSGHSELLSDALNASDLDYSQLPASREKV